MNASTTAFVGCRVVALYACILAIAQTGQMLAGIWTVVTYAGSFTSESDLMMLAQLMLPMGALAFTGVVLWCGAGPISRRIAGPSTEPLDTNPQWTEQVAPNALLVLALGLFMLIQAVADGSHLIAKFALYGALPELAHAMGPCTWLGSALVFILFPAVIVRWLDRLKASWDAADPALRDSMPLDANDDSNET
jgi:hypothetical protein